jgi:hypothetical protein
VSSLGREVRGHGDGSITKQFPNMSHHCFGQSKAMTYGGKHVNRFIWTSEMICEEQQS